MLTLQLHKMDIIFIDNKLKYLEWSKAKFECVMLTLFDSMKWTAWMIRKINMINLDIVNI